MNTKPEILARLKLELQLVPGSTFLTDIQLNSLIDDAHLWAGDQFEWPQLEKGSQLQGGTEVGVYYYEYPGEYKSDTVFRLQVDGKEYDKKSFPSWLKWTQDNPQDKTKRIFTNYGRKWFMFPTPTVSALETLVWGRIQAPAIDTNGYTIFSNSEASLNEAIMLKAKSVALKKADKSAESKLAEDSATLILSDGFGRIAARSQMEQEEETQAWTVPDFFRPLR